MDLHCVKSNAFFGSDDSSRLSSLAGWSFLSKMQMCISQWIEARRGNNVGKHSSSGACLGSPQKCKSFIICGKNCVRNAFASAIGWISSTTNNPLGSIRGNQKKTVWAMCADKCAPSSTTIFNGGASGRFISFFQTDSRNVTFEPSPQ